VTEAIPWWHALLLGAVQGATEFLPVSSDGHLALADALLGTSGGGVAFAVLLHVGTLVAVVLAFPAGLARLLAGCVRLPRALLRAPSTWDDATRFAAKVAVSAIPGAAFGYLFHDDVGATYERLEIVGGGLLVTAAALASTARARPGVRDVGYRDAAILGFAQALALLPGVSRSGMTISAALVLGIARGTAAEFSFVASVPLIVGAAALEASGLAGEGGLDPVPVGIGIVTALVVGFAALVLLVRIVKAGAFHRFAPYCAVVGALAILAAVRGGV
jgi:undecaprenyl-diphosphatase